jgi:hypothetical protein
MPGTQEILILVLIVMGIFFLPRLISKKSSEPVATRPVKKLSGRLRLAIFVSLLWPTSVALYWRPWDRDVLTFLYLAVLPVAALWGIGWVVVGYGKERK